MSSVQADSSEIWKAVLLKNENIFESKYKEDDLREDLKTFLTLQEYGLLVLDYEASWRGVSQCPEDEHMRGIPWLFFAVMDDTVGESLLDYLRDPPTSFHVTVWKLHGNKPDKPLHPDYFYKYYIPASDSERHNWTGIDNRSDNPMLSLETFKLEHLQSNVYVCEVGVKSDLYPVNNLSSEEFYNFIREPDLNVADYVLCAITKAYDGIYLDWPEPTRAEILEKVKATMSKQSAVGYNDL